MIELIVVVGITVLLSSLVLLYGSVGRQQVSLMVEAVKITQVISRAKSLAVATYTDSLSSVCGYGVYFDYSGRKYSIRRYQLLPNCTVPIAIGVSFSVQEFELEKDISWQDGAARVDNVVFLPPEPRTLLFSGGSLLGEGIAGRVYIAGGGASRVITVSPAGQITF